MLSTCLGGGSAVMGESGSVLLLTIVQHTACVASAPQPVLAGKFGGCYPPLMGNCNREGGQGG